MLYSTGALDSLILILLMKKEVKSVKALMEKRKTMEEKQLKQRTMESQEQIKIYQTFPKKNTIGFNSNLRKNFLFIE